MSGARFELLERLEGDHFWFGPRRKLTLGLLQQEVPARAALLLDLGCGPGGELAQWEAFAQKVIGIDQHITREPAHSKDEPCVLQGDVTCVPLEAESSDIVLLLDVLEHTDDRAALCEAHRVLKPGGVVLVSVPAHPWLWSARDTGASHLRRYTRSTLKARLEEAGFFTTRILPYQFFLFPLVVVSRLLGKRASLPRDLEDHPPAFVNALFSWVNRCEVQLTLRGVPVPTGSSFFAVARKPQD
ncbi:MAG: class I SAM-dependent methyltransferase [Pseudomonadota bacterium]